MSFIVKKQFKVNNEVSLSIFSAKISRRTLQDYRNNGILPYRQLGGKILYRESDIERVLQSCYRGKF